MWFLYSFKYQVLTMKPCNKAKQKQPAIDEQDKLQLAETVGIRLHTVTVTLLCHKKWSDE